MTFIGIDQTGAVNSLGTPKPLPGCVLEDNRLSFYYFKEFSSELAKSDPMLICIDCVLGLPSSVDVPLREAMFRTKKIAGFGRAPAQAFFEKLADGKIHHRGIEFKLGANSIFTVYPFQKNIQTGTFRFWKEMSFDPDWFYLPALPNEKNNRQNKVPVVEGYPSHYWKSILKQPHRKPDLIVDILKSKFPDLKIKNEDKKLMAKDVNLVDALVLALAAKYHVNEISRKSTKEGWILGTK